MHDAERSESSETIGVGDSVLVRTRFTGSWANGFEVSQVLDDGYRLRRVSDGALIPEVFDFGDVQVPRPPVAPGKW